MCGQSGEILLGRWRVVEKIGEGTFSQIYTAFDLTNPAHKVAVKVEAPSQMKPVLEWESQVLVALQRKNPYVCKYHHHGKHGDNFILIMELLGDNMSKMRLQPDATHGVPLPKCISAAIQMLDCLEAFHNAGYLHRDIKASNFALSNGKDPKRYFVIDFGLSKQHLDPQGLPIPPRDKAEFRGTSMYASLAAHRREDLGRRDDLWSWMYLVLDFIRGELPWAHDAQKKNREVVVALKEYFTETHPEQMLEGLPGARHLLAIMEHLKGLSYFDAPNYALVRKAVRAVEDANDEASLVQEWDALEDTSERASKWVRALGQGVMPPDMLLKLAKHYASFFELDSPTHERLEMQERIWKLEKRLNVAATAGPPTIQSFGERRQAEQRRKVEALQRRREADVAVRQELAKRLHKVAAAPLGTQGERDGFEGKGIAAADGVKTAAGESPTQGTPLTNQMDHDTTSEFQRRFHGYKKTGGGMMQGDDDRSRRRVSFKPHALMTMYQGLKTLSPLMKSKSNRNIVVNPTLVGMLADPLAKVGEKMHHVAPGTYDEVVERFKAARQEVLERHDRVAVEDRVPKSVGLVKDLLPPDILNEFQVEKQVLMDQKHWLRTQAEHQVHSVLVPAGLHQLKDALHQAGMDTTLIEAVLQNTVTGAQVPALTSILQAHPELQAMLHIVQASLHDDKRGLLLPPPPPPHRPLDSEHSELRRSHAKSANAKSRDLLGSVTLKPEVSTQEPRPDDPTSRPTTNPLYDVPLSILKGLTSPHHPRDKKLDLLTTLTTLANHIVDDKVDEIKLSLVEASHASHALYAATTFILLAVMFGALSLFLLSLFGFVGARIVHNTMTSLQVILLSPQSSRHPPKPTTSRSPDHDKDEEEVTLSPTRTSALGMLSSFLSSFHKKAPKSIATRPSLVSDDDRLAQIPEEINQSDPNGDTQSADAAATHDRANPTTRQQPPPPPPCAPIDANDVDIVMETDGLPPPDPDRPTPHVEVRYDDEGGHDVPAVVVVRPSHARKRQIHTSETTAVEWMCSGRPPSRRRREGPHTCRREGMCWVKRSSTWELHAVDWGALLRHKNLVARVHLPRLSRRGCVGLVVRAGGTSPILIAVPRWIRQTKPSHANTSIERTAAHAFVTCILHQVVTTT
ncbi:hypothetical protein DYB30_000795, partial [Aphanomyces astaci]